MSDVSPTSAPPSAPPPSAPAPSAPPPQAEVPVNESAGQPRRPRSATRRHRSRQGRTSNKSSHIGRREALQNAFADSKQAQEEAAKEAPKRAKPGMGHNQPPEPIAKAEAKKPDDEEAGRDASAEQRRSAIARAASSPGIPTKAAQAAPAKARSPARRSRSRRRASSTSARRTASRPAASASRPRPNGRRRRRACAVPCDKMARDFQGAYERYRGDHEVMEELRPYHDLATKQGTSLRKAFDNYYGMETKLRQDLVGGLDVLVQNVARGQNLRRPNGGLINLQDVALPHRQHDAGAAPADGAAQPADLRRHADRSITPTGRSTIPRYRVSCCTSRSSPALAPRSTSSPQAHPRFDELSDLIKSELDLGFPLEVAYQRADRLRPNTAAQTRNTPAQTRKTSISGAPDGGNGKHSANTRPSDGQRRNGEAKHPTRREAIAKAIRRVGNGV